MKKIFFIMALMLSLSMTARDRLYMNDFSIKAGQTVTVDLILQNDTTYSAFQTDLYLPAGLDVETEDGEYVIDPTSRMTSNHTISSFKQENGAIRIFVSSQGVRTFTGNDGAIATITFKASNSFVGRRQVDLKGTVFVEEDGSKHMLDDAAAWAIGGDAVIGDTNGDGKVDVEDVNAVINIILGLTANDELRAASDVTGDGKIDVEDVNAIINIILKV